VERRAHHVELRAEGRKLEGYAATFDTPADIHGQFTETIQRGAFANSLRDGDILALLDHNETQLLGRTRSKTLQLNEDGKGLRFSLALPQTTLANDLLVMVERGDIGGMSFGFWPVDEVWPSKDQRILRSVDLLEVSVVSAWPAYPGTVVNARARSGPIARRPVAALRLWARTL
jgi:uncharacterized protein